MDKTQFDIKRLDHLGLIAGFCREAGLDELIDKRLPKISSQSRISNGTLLIAMILNGLGLVGRTLHMYPEFFADKPVERLLGQGISASHINDDVMGRLLDRLYEAGVSEVYQEIAHQVMNYLGLPCRSMNIDTTSFHVDGAYQQDMDTKTIHLTHGYSRDHRPDLNQVVLNLITENQAGIPLFMQACSGNAQDGETFKKTVSAHLGSLKAAYQNTYLIGDAALYVAETVQILSAQGQRFITRVPQKLNEAKAVLAQAEQVIWVDMNHGYQGAWFESNYAQVKQRWLLIKSEQAKHREQHIHQAWLRKETDKALISFKKLCRQTFACKSDATQALQTWQAQHEAVNIIDAEMIQKIKRAKPGRPGSTDSATRQFYITGQLASCLQHQQDQANTKGLFILATNDLSESLGMQFVLDEYKSQQAVERGFRFLKSPHFLTSSFFLKKPQRIEALLMVMTCCLMVYAGIEYLIRKNLQQTNTSFPDMKNKPTQRPTARWVFFCFQGVSTLTISTDQSVINTLTTVSDRQKIILHCLGKSYWDFYS